MIPTKCKYCRFLQTAIAPRARCLQCRFRTSSTAELPAQFASTQHSWAASGIECYSCRKVSANTTSWVVTWQPWNYRHRRQKLQLAPCQQPIDQLYRALRIMCNLKLYAATDRSPAAYFMHFRNTFPSRISLSWAALKFVESKSSHPETTKWRSSTRALFLSAIVCLPFWRI